MDDGSLDLECGEEFWVHGRQRHRGQGRDVNGAVLLVLVCGATALADDGSEGCHDRDHQGEEGLGKHGV